MENYWDDKAYAQVFAFTDADFVGLSAKETVSRVVAALDGWCIDSDIVATYNNEPVYGVFVTKYEREDA